MIHESGIHEPEEKDGYTFVRGKNLLLVRGFIHDFVFENTPANRKIVRSYYEKEKRKLKRK